MSTDLIVLFAALGLGLAVVLVGTRRNLSEATRNGLPRFEGAQGEATEAVAPSQGGWSGAGFVARSVGA